MDSDKHSVTLLMVGKTGCGKSATANSILQRAEFKCGWSNQSATREVRIGYSDFDATECPYFSRYEIAVVDTPGIEDSTPEETRTKRYVKAIEQAVSLSESGFDALLLVSYFGCRFTQADQGCVQLLKALLGENVFRDHGIMLLTRGDVYEREKDRLDITFEKWINKQRGPFTELLKDCQDRVVLFDNLTDDVQKQKEQRLNLVEVVNRVRRQKYTAACFERSALSRERVVVEATRFRVSSWTFRELNYISNTLRRNLPSANSLPISTRIENLETLLKPAKELEIYLMKCDKETGSLQDLIQMASIYRDNVEESISTLIKMKEREQEGGGSFGKQHWGENEWKTEQQEGVWSQCHIL